MEVVLVYCNLDNNSYQHVSKVSITFVPNKQLRQLIQISPHSLTMLNTTNTDFSYIEVWFTDQSSKPLEIEDNINMTLIIGQMLKMRYSTEPRYRKYIKSYGFLLFVRKIGDKYDKKINRYYKQKQE